MPDVRVGIVTWNTAGLLADCLAALPLALGSLDWEVVVVDNASSDGCVAVAESVPGVTVVANAENVGYAKGMNLALQGSSAPVLIALNPDTVPAPGSLETLVRRLNDNPSAGMVVPRLVGVDGKLQHSCYRFPSLVVSLVLAVVPPRAQRSWIGRRLWLEGSAPHEDRCPVDWAIGAVHVIRAAPLGGAQPYSERWFMYVEDLELCWRLREQGLETWLEGDVSVEHVGNASGLQRWGGARQRRYWLATYDFVTMTRGALYARALAVANTVTVALLVTAYRCGAGLSPAQSARRRAVAGDLRATLGAHVRVAARGAPVGGEPA